MCDSGTSIIKPPPVVKSYSDFKKQVTFCENARTCILDPCFVFVRYPYLGSQIFFKKVSKLWSEKPTATTFVATL